MKLCPPGRSTLCHAGGHEAGQQKSRVPQVLGETHGPAGDGERTAAVRPSLCFTIHDPPLYNDDV